MLLRVVKVRKRICLNKFILLLKTAAPSKHYSISVDELTGDYCLSLKSGKKITYNEVDCMLNELHQVKVKNVPEAGAAKETDDMKEKADSKENADAKEKVAMKAATKKNAPETMDKATPEKVALALAAAAALITQASQAMVSALRYFATELNMTMQSLVRLE
jgi:hypothetical protein